MSVHLEQEVADFSERRLRLATAITDYADWLDRQHGIDAERTLRLEAAGYATEVVPFVPPTVTPHNLLWRARRVGEPRAMADAAERLERLRAGEFGHALTARAPNV